MIEVLSWFHGLKKKIKKLLNIKKRPSTPHSTLLTDGIIFTASQYISLIRIGRYNVWLWALWMRMLSILERQLPKYFLVQYAGNTILHIVLSAENAILRTREKTGFDGSRARKFHSTPWKTMCKKLFFRILALKNNVCNSRVKFAFTPSVQNLRYCAQDSSFAIFYPWASSYATHPSGRKSQDAA